MECSIYPGCIPVPCIGSTCRSIPNMLQIIRVTNERVSIRYGDTVVLRSVEHYSHFLDCSDPTRCTLSTCRTDYYRGVDLNNDDYVSTCRNHQFEIFGIRRKNKILETSDMIYFRKKFIRINNFEHYLSCNGKTCHLKVKGNCPANQRIAIFHPPRNSSGVCPIDIFKVIKISEL